MKFKRLIEEQNRLEALKNRNELTDYGLEMLTELNQALQLLQTDVVGQSEQLNCDHQTKRYDKKHTSCKKCGSIFQMKPQHFNCIQRFAASFSCVIQDKNNQILTKQLIKK